MRNYLVLGKWNTICDVCGVKYKMTDLQKRWDGLMVCERDWEMRHQQDFLRVPRDDPSVPWTRPETTDTFLIFASGFGQSIVNHEEINGFIING